MEHNYKYEYKDKDRYRYEYNETPLSKAILGALFAGIIATVLNLIYSYVYREITGYTFLGVFTVYTIILFSIVVCMAGGILYFLLKKNIRSGRIIYTVLFLALTIWGLFLHINFNVTVNEGAPSGAHGLTMGIDIITGCTISFLVPYMAEHPRIWG
jgi:hypothetical protein